ncbi:cation-translocating P-type ATPase [Sorangium cellulosum]|uniref:Cation-translocating P-type ATPase n=1 Tax=Sorangium cellulosum TaxID=56 RepID=A0A4P2PSM6_SORCE|nr:HAD-IC family P-type ATPase [Sorangium cellulosum]AUX19555.1 cation-translocating P-type ATPase [Sorangium cellulosum]
MVASRAAGPDVAPLPCSGCSKLIDPLRAGHVAIFDLRFHYFCNTRCRHSFLGEASPQPGDVRPAGLAGSGAPALGAPRALPAPGGAGPHPAAPRAEPARAGADDGVARPADLDAPIVDAFPPVSIDERLPELPVLDDDRALLEPIGNTILCEEPQRHEAAEARDIGALLLVLAIIAGTLAVALTLAGDAKLVIGARIVLATVSAGMLLGRSATTARDATDPHPAPMLAPVLGGLVAAVWALFGEDRALAAEAASLAGVIATASAVSAWLIESARHRVFAERSWIASVLSAPARRPPDAWAQSQAPADRVPPRGDDGLAGGALEEPYAVRPGELVQVDPGEIVPVDLVVTGGDVEVLPWIGATTPARRRDGDPVIAGATVVRGRLLGTCTFAGGDRAVARVLLDPRRRADALAPIAQASRALTERWAIGAAAIGALSAFVAGRAPVEIAMTAVAVLAALSTAVTASIASIHVARGVLLGLRRGIVYKSADAWDRAGRVSVAVFCARGTLLLGEPELAELESTGPKLTPGDVLALAAGAERTEEHPVATAIVRAARVRGLRPDGVRNPNFHPGLGVMAVTSSGEELCVGNRALMLEQRISIAAAESRVAELEALGRTVVLVAVGARLVGLIGLQDGLRPGARAAIQHLLDAQVEPVLMSGDARETCEAIGRSLDIEHIRPEILPADRGAEVRRLIDAGTSVAVLGHAGVDDAALGAADVSVALGAAGSAPADFAAVLASDDVRDAALSLALAHRTRLEARVGLALSVAPALVGAAVVSALVLPPAYAPIAALLGGAVAVVHARALDAKS